MNGRRPVALTSLFAVAMMLGGGGLGLGIPTRNPRAKVPPPDEDRMARPPGCQCHLEEGDSPCLIHDYHAPNVGYGTPTEDGPPAKAWEMDAHLSVMDKAEAKRERKRQARLARQR